MIPMDVKLLALLAIVSMLLGSYIVAGVKANPSPSPIEVNIISPTSYGYNSNSVLLNVSVMVIHDALTSSENRWIAYSLDGQSNVTMTPVYQGVYGGSSFPYSLVTGQAQLSGLPDGWHSIVVYAKYNYGSWVSDGNAKVEFVVGTPQNPNSNSPLVTLNSPSFNQVFKENSAIPYSISISIPSSWFQNNAVTGKIYSVAYTLDNTASIITIAGIDITKGGFNGPIVINDSKPAFIPSFSAQNPSFNLTGIIPSQPLGDHTILVRVYWTDSGNEEPMRAYSQYHFSVVDTITQPNSQPKEPEPFPTATVAAASGASAVVVVGAGLLVYFKKRKR